MTTSTLLRTSAEALVLQQSPIVTFGYIVQVIFSLAIVLGIIYIGGRYLIPRLKTSASGRLIQVVDRIYLEPQVTAYVLKVGRRSWLVMSGNKSVTKISELDTEP